MNLTQLSVSRPIGSLMAVMATCLGGALGMAYLPVDLMPTTESSLVTIFVGVRGGMLSEDIENLVTIPIEEAVATMNGLKEVSSVSRKDKATVTLQFDDSQNVRRATLEVSERLARIKGKLPKEIEKPIVARYNENDHPVVILSATSAVKTPEVIRSLIERDLKPELSQLPGVANVEISGGRQRKILVEFEKSKLDMHRLPILDVIRELGANNLNLASGSFETRRDERVVQFKAGFESLEEMRAFGVANTKEGSRIRLGDVAVVRDYYLEPESYARVNSQPTVSVYIQKESGANTIKVAEDIIKAVDDYQKRLPSDVGIGVSVDQSVSIKQAIADVREALLWGAFLTALVLWMFMKRLKHVGVVIASIPVAVMGTFLAMLIQSTLMRKFGTAPPITINVMSLLGVALGIGRMVDDSIVVFDNIMRRRDEGVIDEGVKSSIFDIDQSKTGYHGISNIEDLTPLVIQATKEMFLAVASSTLILVVIFVPIVFFSADVRRQYADVAFTVVASLMCSLLMAISVIPLLSSRIKPNAQGEELYGWEKRFYAWWKTVIASVTSRRDCPIDDEDRWSGTKQSAVENKVDGHFSSKDRLLQSVFGLLRNDNLSRLCRRLTAYGIRKRGWVLLGVFGSLLFSGALYFFVLEKEFIGETDQKEFVIFVELPAGTKLDVSDKVVAAVEREINALNEIKESVKVVSARVEGWSSKIYVTLVPGHERTRSVQDVIDMLRPKLEQIGGEYEAFIYFSEPSQAKELVIDVFGKDYLKLHDLAVDIAKRMQEIKDLRDVKLRYKPGRPEIQLVVDHERASMFGFSSREVADTLHAQVMGLRATYYNTGSEQVETVARLSEEDRRTLDNISNLTLVSKQKKKQIIPIQQVLDFKNSFTPSEVWRRGKERVIQVSANRERMALSTSVDKVKAVLNDPNNKLQMPFGYYYEFGGDYKKLVRSEHEFIWAFVLMVLLVYMVLACFFESYSQPLLMLLTIPLATAGSMPMLWITDTAVNMGVYIGLLLLGGTVISNAIILIDRLNSVRRSRGLLRSVMKVGLERARPIFMTSLTTIGAMLPLTIAKGESAAIWAPLALTVVSGMALSSVLTLFVIPAAYVVMEDVKKRIAA